MIPDIKAEAAETKAILQFGLECFPATKSIEDANACNARVCQMSKAAKHVEVDDFGKWDEAGLAETLGQFKDEMKTVICEEQARNLAEIKQCDQPP